MSKEIILCPFAPECKGHLSYNSLDGYHECDACDFFIQKDD